MFLRHFAARRGQMRYEDFRRRYYEYHPDDCVTICEEHHAEIHKLYLPIIDRECKKLAKPMCRWSWGEADRLMEKLERACDRWLQTVTPGARWDRP